MSGTAGRPAPVLIGIDGRSGSGKTHLADALRRRLEPHTDVAVLPLELLYPGWDGLAAATHDDGAYVRAVTDLASGRAATWRAWDWHADDWGETRVTPPASVVLFEGVGALCRSARDLLTLGVWIELEPARRRHRALARDGETYRPHWDRWARQETAYLAAHRPREHADLVLGAAATS